MNKQGIALWILVCAVLVLDIGIRCVRAQNSSSKVLKAHELQIVDSAGNVRVDLSVGKDDGSAIRFNDTKGQTREALLAGATGGYVGLLDASGHPTLLLDGTPTPDLGVYKGGKSIAVLQVSNNGPAFALGDGVRDRAYLGYDAQKDVGTVRLEGTTGSQRAELNQVASSSLIDVTDQQGILRAELKCVSGDQPSLALCDTAGGLAWSQTDQTGQ